jgi:hypothetical protein
MMVYHPPVAAFGLLPHTSQVLPKPLSSLYL